jgi:peptidoglycan hydrolase-like protein with peptidoglycan-binding domain
VALLLALASPGATNSLGANKALIIDTTAPTITAISYSTTANNTTTITWTTDESASSQVEYGTTPIYGNTTTQTDTSPRVTSHSVVIPSLASCTPYRFRVISIDTALNSTTSSQYEFVTNGGCASSNGGGGGGGLGNPVNYNTNINSSTAITTPTSATEPQATTNSTTLTKSCSQIITQKLVFGNKDGQKGIKEVEILQNFLNKHGFPVGATDGVFGIKTKKGVLTFQKENAIRIDAIVGPETRQAINNYCDSL